MQGRACRAAGRRVTLIIGGPARLPTRCSGAPMRPLAVPSLTVNATPRWSGFGSIPAALACAAAYRLHLREVKAAIAASLSGAEDADEDELTIASNAPAELVRAGKLDEAEQAARDLLLLFPDVHDGYDRLGIR